MRDTTVNPPPGYSVFIYRLTHGQTEEEWATFVQKLETHIGAWARDTPQYDDIAPHYKLHWLDGKTLNIQTVTSTQLENGSRTSTYPPKN